MANKESPKSYPFSELILSDDQRELVELFGKFGAERLGISPVPLRGFLWKAAREWQQRNQASIETLRSSSPEERLKGAEEIAQLFLQRMLNAFPQERHDEIRQAVEIGLATYRERFSRR